MNRKHIIQFNQNWASFLACWVKRNKHGKSEHQQFNCKECFFQGSSKEEFSKHHNIAHLKQTTHKEDGALTCHTCQNMFLSKTELMQHRKLDHPQNVRPCKYYTQGNCARKKEKCWYSHDSVEDMETDQNDKLKANYVYNCKFCDKTFASKHMFMLHKKTDHIEAVPHCTKFNKGNCRLTSAQCWYTHKENEHAYKQEHVYFSNSSHILWLKSFFKLSKALVRSSLKQFFFL